jgi:hypothetical protein
MGWEESRWCFATSESFGDWIGPERRSAGQCERRCPGVEVDEGLLVQFHYGYSLRRMEGASGLRVFGAHVQC